MPLIHMEVPEEWNKIRKGLDMTWREIIKAGLETKKPEPPPPAMNKPEIRSHLIAASKAIKAADDLLKGSGE